MSYSTPEKFYDQMLPSEALDGLGGTSTVQGALDIAAGRLNSYLKKRYALPLTSWGEDLEYAEMCLAQYQLISRRGFSPQSQSDVNAKELAADTIEWIKLVAKSEVEPDEIVDSTPDLDEAGTLAGPEDTASFNYFTGRDC
jgi:phage gp36-like protein